MTNCVHVRVRTCVQENTIISSYSDVKSVAHVNRTCSSLCSDLKHGRRKRLVKFGYARGRRKFSFVSHDSRLIALVYSLTLRSTEFNYLRQCCRFQLDSRLGCSHSDLQYTELWQRRKRYQKRFGRKFVLDTAEIFKFQISKFARKYNVHVCEIINNITWRKLRSTRGSLTIKFHKISEIEDRLLKLIKLINQRLNAIYFVN